jgi:hypothetical protein
VIVSGDEERSLSLATRVDFVQLCTHKMHIELEFLCIKRFLGLMFAITHTTSAFPEACREKRRCCQIMGGAVLFGDKPIGHKFCRARQTALYVSKSHYGLHSI